MGEDELFAALDANQELLHTQSKKMHKAFAKAVAAALPPSLMAKFEEGGGPLELLAHVFHGGWDDDHEPEDNDLFVVLKGRVPRYRGCEDHCGMRAYSFDTEVTALERWALAKARRVLDIPTDHPQPRWIMGLVHFNLGM